jgi:hypothetical protein
MRFRIGGWIVLWVATLRSAVTDYTAGTPSYGG